MHLMRNSDCNKEGKDKPSILCEIRFKPQLFLLSFGFFIGSHVSCRIIDLSFTHCWYVLLCNKVFISWYSSRYQWVSSTSLTLFSELLQVLCITLNHFFIEFLFHVLILWSLRITIFFNILSFILLHDIVAFRTSSHVDEICSWLHSLTTDYLSRRYQRLPWCRI